MNPTIMAALLGRPLTSIESANFSLYLKIARESLDTLLCMNLCDEEEVRTFDANEGYSTVWTDIFTEIEEVRVNDTVITDYSMRQGDRRTGSWYNSIVFDSRFNRDGEVQITATWGFSSVPSDLQNLLAGLFGLITKKNRFDGSIQSKQVEGFRITFNTDADLDDEFYKSYSSVISKYSLCDKQGLRHGSVCNRCSRWSCIC